MDVDLDGEEVDLADVSADAEALLALHDQVCTVRLAVDRSCN